MKYFVTYDDVSTFYEQVDSLKKSQAHFITGKEVFDRLNTFADEVNSKLS